MDFLISLNLLFKRFYLMISQFTLLIQIDTRPYDKDSSKGCLYFRLDFETKKIDLRFLKWKFWMTKLENRKIIV